VFRVLNDDFGINLTTAFLRQTESSSVKHLLKRSVISGRRTWLRFEYSGCNESIPGFCLISCSYYCAHFL